MFEHVRKQWPGATVQASTLEAFLDGLSQSLAAGGLTLPVVTGECNSVPGRGWCCWLGAGVGLMSGMPNIPLW